MQSKLRPALMTAALLSLALGSSNAEAHGAKGHQNLQIVSGANNRALDKAMKDLSKGLGVKCGACHVKGAYDRDDLPSKAATREFLQATIGQRNSGRRAEALDDLLAALDLDQPKSEAKVWKAVRSLKKKPKRRAARHLH